MTFTIRDEGTPPPAASALATTEARELHAAIVGAKGELQRNALRLGRALNDMKNGRGYQALGFTSFDDYLASPTVGIARSTAFTFMGVARTFGQSSMLDLAEQVDYTKLDVLRRVIMPGDSTEEVTAVMAWANEVPRAEVRRLRRRLAEAEDQAHLGERPAFRVAPPRLPAPPPRWEVARPDKQVIPIQVVPRPEPASPPTPTTPATSGTIPPLHPLLTQHPLLTDFDHLLMDLRTVTSGRHADEMVRRDEPEAIARLLIERDAGRKLKGESSFEESLRFGYKDLLTAIAWLQRVTEAYHKGGNGNTEGGV